jgi:protein NrfD
MNEPASTLFTAPPHWRWLIIGYFFVGGIAGGCYFLAALLDLRGLPQDRRLARRAYLVAFPATVLCGILLTVDLTRPLRFWHMLLQSETLRPMIKWWSPMSLGAWALLLFGGVSLLSFLGALATGEAPRPRWYRRPGARALRPPAPLGVLISLVGAILGLFLAGYTGVLLSVTNRPIWADTGVLGLAFLLSSASTAAAFLLLLTGARAADPTVHGLQRFDSIALVLELIALVALVISLGSLARLWLDAWGALLLFGVVLAGIVLPLALHVRGPRAAAPAAAVLVLAGGFLLRAVVVLSSNGVRV